MSTSFTLGSVQPQATLRNPNNNQITVVKNRPTFADSNPKKRNSIHVMHKSHSGSFDADLVQTDNQADQQIIKNKVFIKLTDFGLAIVRGGMDSTTMLQNFCGTPVYMAPEILKREDYSQTVDVWAMGVIAYYLIAGTYPWLTKNPLCNDRDQIWNPEIIENQIKAGKVLYNNDLFSKGAQNCISRMLCVDTATRITAGEVFEHPWTNGEKNVGSAPMPFLEMLKRERSTNRN